MVSPLIMVIAAAVLVAFGFGTGWQTRAHWDAGTLEKYKNEVLAEKQAADVEAKRQTDRANEIADRFETRLAKLRIVNTTVQQETRRETEKLVYGNPNCDVPATGVVLVNNAVGEANRAAGYVQGQVSPPAGTTGGVDRPGNAGGPVQP